MEDPWNAVSFFTSGEHSGRRGSDGSIEDSSSPTQRSLKYTSLQHFVNDQSHGPAIPSTGRRVSDEAHCPSRRRPLDACEHPRLIRFSNTCVESLNHMMAMKSSPLSMAKLCPSPRIPMTNNRAMGGLNRAKPVDTNSMQSRRLVGVCFSGA